jgi:hypothetical protein
MKQLPIQPPREYRNIEAFIGRVWRLKEVLWIKESIFWLLFLSILGFLLKQALLLFYLGGLVILLGIMGVMTYIWLNLKRAALVRTGLSIKGKIDDMADLNYFHELLRGKAHRSCFATYSFELEGKTYQSRIYLCRCALIKLQKQESLWIVYDPKQPNHHLPLKAAVLTIPH